MRERRSFIISILGIVLLSLAIVIQAAAATSDLLAEVSGHATTVKLWPIKDNTLYEDSAGALSNGARRRLRHRGQRRRQRWVGI